MFTQYVTWPIVDLCLLDMLLGQLSTSVCQVCCLANCRLLFARYVTWPIVDLCLPDMLLGQLSTYIYQIHYLGQLSTYVYQVCYLGQLSTYIYLVCCYLANCRLMFTRYVTWPIVDLCLRDMLIGLKKLIVDVYLPDMLLGLKKLLVNGSLLLVLVGFCCDTYIYGGFIAFLSKYLEVAFNLTPYVANMYTGKYVNLSLRPMTLVVWF